MMDGTAAIEQNHEALRRILAALFAMAGLTVGAGFDVRVSDCAATLPRRVRLAVLRLLRPAEAAARRLIIALAMAMPLPLDGGRVSPRRKPERNSSIVRDGVGTGIVLPRAGGAPARNPAASARPPAFPLLDPLPRMRRFPWALPTARRESACPALPAASPSRRKNPHRPTIRSTSTVSAGGWLRLAAPWTICRERPGALRAGGREMPPFEVGDAFAGSGRCGPDARPAPASGVSTRPARVGGASARSMTSCLTPTRSPSSPSSVPTRHEPARCVRLGRRLEEPRTGWRKPGGASPRRRPAGVRYGPSARTS